MVVGCSVIDQEVNAFEGRITAVKIGGLEVECTSAVNQDETQHSTEDGWPCLVLVPQETPVHTENGNLMNMQDFRDQAREEELLKVRVTLHESRDISEDPESRKVRASKITVLE